MDTEKFQFICSRTNKLYIDYYENTIDISTFKNGSFCFLYPNKVEYYSNINKLLYDIPLDYCPTHLLTLTIKSKLYAIIRNRKSLYLYLLENKFIYKTKIEIKYGITYMTNTKNNQIIICSKNIISFYEIKDDAFKIQNDIIIEEQTFIENSLYFKTNKEIKEKIKDKESNSKNLLILKIFELKDDYIIVIKKQLYKIVDRRTVLFGLFSDSKYILDQKSLILVSIMRLSKKEQKIETIYENEFQIKFQNEYDDYYEIKEFINQLYFFDDNIINSIDVLNNKILFNISMLEYITIKEINSSLNSILYNPIDIERYKIIYLSEKYYYIFEYTYDKYLKLTYTKRTLFKYDIKKDYSDYEIFFIKRINSLLFICGYDTFTISKKFK